MSLVLEQSKIKNRVKVNGLNGGKSKSHSQGQYEEEIAGTKLNGHPDHTSALARLKKVKGQINGLEKMIAEKRYCVDILVQFRAIASALNVIEALIFERHIKNCVVDAVHSKNGTEIQKKADELIHLILKRL